MEFAQPLIEQLRTMWLGFVQTIPSIVLATVTLLITWLVAMLAIKVLRSVLKRSRIRPSLAAFFLTMTKVLVWTLGLLIALTIIFPSLTPARLLAAVGLGSVAIGFAFKDIFENFLAGALIMLRKPMRIGDFIKCESVEGKVEQIAIRDTYVRKTNDELILVPNSYLFKNPVYIKTDKNLRRFDIVCGVAYDVDLEQARNVILEAVTDLDMVDQRKGVEVYAREFNSSSIDFTVRWWSQSKPIDMHKSRDAVIRAIKRALDDADIEIPFPYRTLTFKEPLPVVQKSVQQNDNSGDVT